MVPTHPAPRGLRSDSPPYPTSAAVQPSRPPLPHPSWPSVAAPTTKTQTLGNPDRSNLAGCTNHPSHPPFTQRPPLVTTTRPAPAVNHAALLYFLHLQDTYIRVLSDIFLRASLLPSAS